MLVGIPTEIKEDENRVAITPSGVAAFTTHGHDVVIQKDAGAGRAIRNEAYRRAGATIVAPATQRVGSTTVENPPRPHEAGRRSWLTMLDSGLIAP